MKAVRNIPSICLLALSLLAAGCGGSSGGGGGATVANVSPSPSPSPSSGPVVLTQQYAPAYTIAGTGDPTIPIRWFPSRIGLTSDGSLLVSTSAAKNTGPGDYSGILRFTNFGRPGATRASAVHLTLGQPESDFGTFAVSPKDEIYLGDYTLNAPYDRSDTKVAVLSADGTLLRTLNNGASDGVFGASGNLYVTSTASSDPISTEVYRVSNDGSTTTGILLSDPLGVDGAYIGFSRAAVSPQEDVYVYVTLSNSKTRPSYGFLTCHSDGSGKRFIPIRNNPDTGWGQFTACDHDGNLYINTRESQTYPIAETPDGNNFTHGIQYIRKFTPDGKELAAIPLLGIIPTDLKVDANGNVYVVDQFAVHVYQRTH